MGTAKSRRPRARHVANGEDSSSRGRRQRASAKGPKETTPRRKTRSILAIDIGGSKIKFLVSGETEPRRFEAGRETTPARAVEGIREISEGWEFDAVSIGYPGLVGPQGPRSEPLNLGSGWVGFDFAAAFGLPVRMINDAAMQALGSYDGGRMLFLGFGTGLGSALISENVIIPLELGQIRDRNGLTWGELLGRRGLKRRGKKAWRRDVARIVPALMASFLADYVVLGGGNAKELQQLPPGVRLGNNLTAFRGGFRLWHIPEIQTLPDHHAAVPAAPEAADWRLI